MRYSKNLSFSPCSMTPVWRSKPSSPTSPTMTGMPLATKVLYTLSNVVVMSFFVSFSKVV
ncbi:hypothetical protein D3C73_1622820 [compost metagenome]